jgi:hypothetical protein
MAGEHSRGTFSAITCCTLLQLWRQIEKEVFLKVSFLWQHLGASALGIFAVSVLANHLSDELATVPA